MSEISPSVPVNLACFSKLIREIVSIKTDFVKEYKSIRTFVWPVWRDMFFEQENVKGNINALNFIMDCVFNVCLNFSYNLAPDHVHKNQEIA